MHHPSTADRGLWRGMAVFLFFAMTSGLGAQPFDALSGGSRQAGVPSEKDFSVVRQIIHSEWMGVSWKPLIRYDNYYDHHAQVWSQEMSAWADGDWRLAGRTLTTYDNRGALLSLTRQSWNGAMWVSLERERHSVDMDSGDRTLMRYSWHNGDWELRGRSVFQYTDDNKVQSVRDYDWSDDGWRITVLTQYFYDGMGQYAGYERTELPDNFLSARSEATVAPCGELGEEIHYVRERGGQWERSHRERWTCGINHLPGDRYVDDWADGAWIPWQWDSYISAPYTLSARAASAVTAFSVSPYPNPVQGQNSVQLTVEVPRAITGSIECHDLLGRKLLSLPARHFDAGSTVLSMQIGALPRGYVFIRLIGETRVLVTRRLLIR